MSFYLEWRSMYLERRGIRSNRLFPVKRVRVYQAIYEAMDRVLGYRFQPRLIRHRVTDHLSKYLSAFEVNALTGHAGRDVVEKHYLQRDNLEDLRAKYDKAIEEVPCLRG
jgi:integrase